MQRTASQVGNTSCLALLVLGVLLVHVPGAQADVAYEGPGSSGVVPAGDGGVGARNGTGKDVTFVRVVGLPEDACRLDLEPGFGTAAEWTPGDTVARIWADEGRTNVPFRIRAHWLPDLKGDCTVEVTPDGRVYHDPTGRPFVALEARPEERRKAVTAGAIVLLNATLLNNGTIEDLVNARLVAAPGDWEIRWTHEHRRVPLAPGERVVYTLEAEVPAASRGFASVTVAFLAVESKEETSVTLIVDIGASPTEVRSVAVSGEEDAAPQVVVPPREYVWEAPVAGPIPLVVLLVALVVVARRHSSSPCCRIGRRGSP